MNKRAYNFSPGPAILPEAVLENLQGGLLNFQGTGVGILELSHRSDAFEKVITQAESLLRSLLDIPDSYAVVFLQGGATLQFSMVPMNLAIPDTTADYIITGVWSEKAIDEAKKVTATNIAASSKDNGFSDITHNYTFSDNSSYVHFTSNNTIYGTQFHKEPEVGNRVLVCDASSDLLYKKIDINKYGLIYAGAQKNIGTSGVTVAIIRKDLLSRSQANLPIMLNYNTFAKSGSLYNTPPVFSILVLKEYLSWLSEKGLAWIEKNNQQKAGLIYDAIDSHADFYRPLAVKSARSLMNITFKLPNEEIEKRFLLEAEKENFLFLAGHRNAGGIRVSVYNGFPIEGCEKLAAFMKRFAGK
jgi:phosphoserine aminotransferase